MNKEEKKAIRLFKKIEKKVAKNQKVVTALDKQIEKITQINF